VRSHLAIPYGSRFSAINPILNQPVTGRLIEVEGNRLGGQIEGLPELRSFLLSLCDTISHAHLSVIIAARVPDNTAGRSALHLRDR